MVKPSVKDREVATWCGLNRGGSCCWQEPSQWDSGDSHPSWRSGLRRKLRQQLWPNPGLGGRWENLLTRAGISQDTAFGFRGTVGTAAAQQTLFLRRACQVSNSFGSWWLMCHRFHCWEVLLCWHKSPQLRGYILCPIVAGSETKATSITIFWIRPRLEFIWNDIVIYFSISYLAFLYPFKFLCKERSCNVAHPQMPDSVVAYKKHILRYSGQITLRMEFWGWVPQKPDAKRTLSQCYIQLQRSLTCLNNAIVETVASVELRQGAGEGMYFRDTEKEYSWEEEWASCDWWEQQVSAETAGSRDQTAELQGGDFAHLRAGFINLGSGRQF